MATTEVLILHSGGLRSLISLASALTQTDVSDIALLHLREGRVGGATRAARAKKQAEHYKVDHYIDLPLLQMHLSSKAAGEPQGTLIRPRMLMIAMSHALSLKAKRIIWPTQLNGDHTLVGRALEQAMLVEHISELEHEAAPRIATPLLELTDKQLIELGGQLNVPWELAWSCELHGEQPCGMCNSCVRRHKAFELAGIIDPALKSQPVH